MGEQKTRPTLEELARLSRPSGLTCPRCACTHFLRVAGPDGRQKVCRHCDHPAPEVPRE